MIAINPNTITSSGSPLNAPDFNPNLIGRNPNADIYMNPKREWVPMINQFTPEPQIVNRSAEPSTIPNGVNVTPENYKEKALLEIARQNRDLFSNMGVPNGRQIAIVDAYRRLAGLEPIISDDVARRTKQVAEDLTLTNAAKRSIESLGDVSSNVVTTVGTVAKNVSNPFSLVSIAVLAGIGLFFFVRR